VGDDGREIACFWLEVMRDPENPPRQRLEASKLLAEHGWGKPPSVDAAWSATVGGVGLARGNGLRVVIVGVVVIASFV
jgi:hypothetical protein